jgi:thiamine pyrophosphate-dependent acetolactate synthase large subunit-like protein
MLKGVEAKAPSVTLIHYCGLNSSPAEEILDAHGWPRVMRTEDFASAFDAAVASGLPAVLELRVDPEQITPEARLKKN